MFLYSLLYHNSVNIFTCTISSSSSSNTSHLVKLSLPNLMFVIRKQSSRSIIDIRKLRDKVGRRNGHKKLRFAIVKHT